MLAIIGGSGLYSLDESFELDEQLSRKTPYGETSADILQGRWHGIELAFLPRHGPKHKIPPHRINYRANLWALNEAGVAQIIAVNAVGGIDAQMAPQTLVLPDQIVDYTSGREFTFSDGEDSPLRHVDFTWPYSAGLRDILQRAAEELGRPLVPAGTYGCSNGPRLESAAEIRRMQNDGCAIVGMTGMPEAALARELDIEYASLALVVNWAAGVTAEVIEMQEIIANMEQGMQGVRELLLAAARSIES